MNTLSSRATITPIYNVHTLRLINRIHPTSVFFCVLKVLSLMSQWPLRALCHSNLNRVQTPPGKNQLILFFWSLQAYHEIYNTLPVEENININRQQNSSREEFLNFILNTCIATVNHKMYHYATSTLYFADDHFFIHCYYILRSQFKIFRKWLWNPLYINLYLFFFYLQSVGKFVIVYSRDFIF